MQCSAHLHDGKKPKCSLSYKGYKGMDKSHTPVHSSHLITLPFRKATQQAFPISAPAGYLLRWSSLTITQDSFTH